MVHTDDKEKRVLRSNKNLHDNKLAYNYTILLENDIVGATGIKIDQHRKYIGEIGYFVDRNHWGKGIASQAVGLKESITFFDLDIERIELITLKQNKPSIRLAQKCGYKKEGIQRHKLKPDGKWQDAYLFAKIRS